MIAYVTEDLGRKQDINLYQLFLEEPYELPYFFVQGLELGTS
jgi:hypothetical protein